MIERLAIFGATGDLTARYLLPGLAALHAAGQLGDRFQLAAAGREDWGTGDFRQWATAQLGRHGGEFPAAARRAVVAAARYYQADVADVPSVAEVIAGGGPVAAYLALPPAVFPVAVSALHDAGLPPGSRIVLEKPFGEDLDSAVELNRLLAGLVPEPAVFRVDHFLAMTTVQNVLGTRLANRMLEPIWNSTHIAGIDIIWDESLALEGRAAYYDGVGALKDMLQNHLLQLLCLVAMEPPVSLGERDLRDRKLDVLRSVRPLAGSGGVRRTRRARYLAGQAGGRRVPAYVDEEGVSSRQRTETFAEMELELDNWRWPGTVFRLRTGKALGRDRKEVAVHFRSVPHLPFGHSGEALPNVLRFGLDPESLTLDLTGIGARAHTLVPLELTARIDPPELPAYGRLLLDVLTGNAALSIRGDEAEEAWRVVAPVLSAWSKDLVPLLEYPAGSAGPGAAGPSGTGEVGPMGHTEPPPLRSQRLRLVNHQRDALRLGMNWTEEDLGKPQVLVDSADGMGHPGTFHFRELTEEVSNGVYEAGGKPGVFAVSDICDGVVQATDGMSYSLISRDIMAAMVEIHALGHPHDGMVLVSGNDKSVPAHLLAIARCDLPAIHLPGGTQLNAPGYVTSNKMWEMGAAVERGELPREDLESAQRGACPTCGACQFMGSASTGQVLAEALGLALPGSALVPAPLTKLLRYARTTGKQLVSLIQQDLRPRAILTREAFENAIVLHAAIGGSTNALLHIPPIAREAGVEVTIDDFDRIHRRVPVLANVKTTGRYPVEYFWYAGGVPAVMLELRDLLHLDCLTVTGKTLGENLDEIEQNPFFFAERRGYLNNFKINKEEVIRPRSDPFAMDGGVAILYGNLAPGGAMIKTFSVPKEMHIHTGRARVFEHEDHAIHALLQRELALGDVMVIRYEGPRANGMPEMYFAAAILAADPVLNTTTAIVTDGRYSGAMCGPCIGHVAPEAIDGGPIVLVAENDLIEINVPERRLAIVGTEGERRPADQIDAILADRRRGWQPQPPRHGSGILSLYSRVARGAPEGASIT